MKNVTVTMAEDLVRKVRVAAAHEGKSLSKFIAQTMEQRVGRVLSQHEAVQRFLAGPAWQSSGDALPTRDETYAERVRRHERPDLSTRPGFSEQGGASSDVADGPRRARRGGDQSAGDE